MPAAKSDPALIVFDRLLGPSNIAQLHEVSERSKQYSNRTLEDKISSLAASDTEVLLEKTLVTILHLAGTENTELDRSELESIVRTTCDGAIRLDAGNENSKLVTEAAVASLSIISSRYSFSLGEQDLLRLTAITDPQDPWTTAMAATTASKLLSDQLTSQQLADFIASDILQKLLKPLFMKVSPRVTASGRPSHYANVEGGFRPSSEAQTWKAQVPWAETTIRWAVNSSSTRLIQDHWPLFMPVLLALIEHNSIEVKTRGLRILKVFVRKCPDNVLQNTGIGRVFVDVTFPLLLYLPSVTPEDQSIAILAPAYDVLVELAESTGSPGNTERRKLLDKLLRDGILAGYFHASRHTRIMEILMQKTTAIVDCLGIYSTRHLKPLLSMISSIMTDPFAVSYPPTSVAAAQALDSIVINTWPRIREGEHMESIVRTISLCWLNVSEEIEHNAVVDSGSGLKSLSWHLAHTGEILQTLWVQNASIRPPKLNEVLEQEPRLAKLFTPAST